MTTEQDKVLERVRKMIRLANDSGATEGERDNALRMARATLEKYNLDMAQVETETSKPQEDRMIKGAVFYGRPWARAAAAAAGDLCFCSYLYVTGRLAAHTKHIFVGRTSNAITAAELAQYLVESIHRQAKAHQRKHGLGNESYRAFAWGAASAIRRRVVELRLASEKASEASPSGGKGLIVYQANENAANQEFVAGTFPQLSKGRNGQGFADATSARAGRDYGETVSLDRQVSGATQKTLT